jgi:hypothetical protein
MKRCLMTTCFGVLVVSAVLAQEKKTVPPPPKPEQEAPSLEVTMKFIQDKMNDHGPVFTEIRINQESEPGRNYFLLFDVVADASTCTLHVKKKLTVPDKGWENVEIITIPFRDMDSIAVESEQEMMNRRIAEHGHPENSISYTPPVYGLTMNGTKKDVFSFHSIFTSGKQPPQTTDSRQQQADFSFRDKQTADRIAKAMTHAVELCGDGNKEPF